MQVSVRKKLISVDFTMLFACCEQLINMIGLKC